MISMRVEMVSLKEMVLESFQFSSTLVQTSIDYRDIAWIPVILNNITNPGSFPLNNQPSPNP